MLQDKDIAEHVQPDTLVHQDQLPLQLTSDLQENIALLGHLLVQIVPQVLIIHMQERRPQLTVFNAIQVHIVLLQD